MATFHLRRNPESDRWRWRLVDDEDKVMACSPTEYATKGEANASLERARQAFAEAGTTVDTTVAGSRWRGIDMTDGRTLDTPGPDAATEPDEPDEGETGPPEVDLTGTPPRDAA